MHSLLVLMFLAARIYVADSGENKITVIDPGKASTAISVSGSPQGIAAFLDGHRLYVSTSGANALDVIDSSTLRLTRSVPVGPGPNGIATSPDGRRVFVTLTGRPAVDLVDAASLKKIKSIEVAGPPHSIAVTPDGTRMLVGSTGKISVINIRTERTEFDIPLTRTPVSIAVDSDRHLVIHRLFLRMAEAGGFEILDYASRKVTGKVALPSANVLATSPDHRSLWATAADSVTVFSLPDLKRVTTIATGAGADGIAFTADGKSVYIANSGAGSISEIDTATFKETAHIPAGKGPTQIIVVE
jgi:YVTN family beta-propeller protein